MEETLDLSSRPLEPLPYHLQIRDYLKEEETEVWDWFRSHRVQKDQAEAVRFDLLKSTYRVDRAAQPDWYEVADQAAAALHLDVPVTIYQAQSPEGMNASVAYLPEEAHVVLSGPVASKMDRVELLSIFSHELAHLLLWQHWDGDFLVIDQVLAALTMDRQAHPAHQESARLFYLYNEIFCDRASLVVTKDHHAVVSALVKISSGLESVSAESYLKQAVEIFEKDSGPSTSTSHPEVYIRARAVQLWHESDQEADSKIADMIQGPPVLDELDLLAQRRVASMTRRMIDLLLTRSWMQTDLTLGHAKHFFSDYSPPSTKHSDASLAVDLQTKDQPLIDYYCYVLLDFVTVDRDLEEAPLAAALDLAEQLNLQQRFGEIVRKELKLRKEQLDRIVREKDNLLETAAKELASKP